MNQNTMTCVRRSDGGNHLPRRPVAAYNLMVGFALECTYCGMVMHTEECADHTLMVHAATGDYPDCTCDP